MVLLALAIEEPAHLLRVDTHIDFVHICKGYNLQIVSVCTSLGHCLQVLLESRLNFLGSRTLCVCRLCQCTWILPFRLPIASTSPTARVDDDEGFEVFCVCTHVFDGSSTELDVLGLITEQLIGEGVEQTISLNIRSVLAVMYCW